MLNVNDFFLYYSIVNNGIMVVWYMGYHSLILTDTCINVRSNFTTLDCIIWRMKQDWIMHEIHWIRVIF